ncbi:WD40 repeat protein [Clostridium tetanomorphum]|uniref:Uncharacterized protein n=1 Tax=Clostridium tetanomorphum TaxID=1553 RepID=A0A923EEX0_CLOTT|nr:hypothetical protein [Clostridium tetanomorphum]KAJ50738.1 hypothetical protein CTM_16417 [Clostridium tetanomorphum DSM 665]MBC2399965.1 hypothetical protein [Clostridium tetanomorphum]MBP1865835.1 WD40 repeat protein [Clostridium tetanomorphum]NRS85284.1 WD40 repeat protein [Clostridium tetanomorphum]NRZ98461.1 WD40 repeat protein [Clostridium tetanomorphum]
MNTKRKGLILKVSIPALIIGSCVGVEYFFTTKAQGISEKPIIMVQDSLNIPNNNPLQIINKQEYKNIPGLYEVYGFSENDEVILSIGMTKDELKKKYKDFKLDKMPNEKIDNFYKDQYGNLYKLNLNTMEKTILKDNNEYINNNTVKAEISPRGKNIAYLLNGKSKIYNLKTDEIKSCGISHNDNWTDGVWSKDGNFIINFAGSGLEIYNIKANKGEIININKEGFYISIIPGFFSEDGKEIYFIGEEKGNKGDERRQGIYKINVVSKKIDSIMLLPYVDRTKKDFIENCIPSAQYEILNNGKSILLQAIVNGEDGTYMYDVENKKFNRVIFHMKSKEGGFSSPCYVSPDRTKVVYVNRAKENGKECWNLYAARINENNFTNRICLAKDIDLGGRVPNWVHWSHDGKKIMFYKADTKFEDRVAYSNINIINVITIK